MPIEPEIFPRFQRGESAAGLLEAARPCRNRHSAPASRKSRRRGALRGLLVVAFLLMPQAVRAAGFDAAPGLDPTHWPFLPIPEVEVDPNGGTTAGFLPAVLFTNDEHEITRILAPDILYNRTLGIGGTFRFLSFPSEETQWYAVAGASETIARQVDLDFATGITRRDPWSFEAHFFFERDPTRRFFGIGNQASTRDETNFSNEEVFGDLFFGWNPTPRWQIALEERPRFVRIQRGAFRTLPQPREQFPLAAGLGGGTELLHRVVLSYDSRDSINVPRSGMFLAAFAGVTGPAAVSTTSYSELGINAAGYRPLGPQLTLAGHLYLRYGLAGSGLPFWAMSRLGGENNGEVSSLGIALDHNQQPFRGEGAGRYFDHNVIVANLELRARVFEMDLFDTHGILELAPFVDLGRVFHRLGDDPFDPGPLHPAAGLGIRGLALPFVVAYFDVGYGENGFAAFSGVNYPF